MPKSGRTRKTSQRQERTLVRLIKTDPKRTASDVRKHAKEAFGLQISQSTAQRILRRHKLNARRPARKPLLKQSHRMARLLFAKAHQNWNVADWRKVIWSDESKFNLFNSDCGNIVRRPPGKRYDAKYVKSTMKFGGGGGVLVWGLCELL